MTIYRQISKDDPQAATVNITHMHEL